MRLTEAPVLPPLPPQEYAQLRDSIRERGVLQPILIITSARKLLTNRSYGVSYHLCSG